MSRHTLNDGVTPDLRITNKSFHWHANHLGPPSLVIGAYYRQEIAWEEFSKRYLDYITTDSLCNITLEMLTKISRRHDVEFVCIEETPEKCHRRLLGEWLRTKNPDLEIIIK